MLAQDVLPRWAEPVPLQRLPGRSPQRSTQARGSVPVQDFHRLTLVELLVRNFPRTGRRMAFPKLAAMARRFVITEPPRHERLFSYGSGFPGFLAEQPELAERPWLAELARLEWAVHKLRLARDVPELSASRIAALPAKLLQSLSLRVRPTFLPFSSRWPVVTLFDDAEAPAEEPVRPEPVHLLLRHDPEHGLVKTIMDLPRFVFLREIAGGSTVGLAARTAAARDPGFDLPGAFGYLIAIGAFAAPDESEP